MKTSIERVQIRNVECFQTNFSAASFANGKSLQLRRNLGGREEEEEEEFNQESKRRQDNCKTSPGLTEMTSCCDHRKGMSERMLQRNQVGSVQPKYLVLQGFRKSGKVQISLSLFFFSLHIPQHQFILFHGLANFRMHPNFKSLNFQQVLMKQQQARQTSRSLYKHVLDVAANVYGTCIIVITKSRQMCEYWLENVILSFSVIFLN